MDTVWDRATEFCHDRLATIMPIAVLLIFLPLSVQGNLAPLVPGTTPGGALLIRLLGLAMALVSLVGQLAIVALAIAPQQNAGAATAQARRRLLPAIAAVLVLMLGLALLAAPALLMAAAAGIDPTTMAAFSDNPTGSAATPPVSPGQGLPQGLAWSLAGYVLVSGLVALWLAARFALLYPVVVAERRGIGALMRSFALTRGLAIAIIGVLLLYATVSTIAALAAKTLFGSVLGIVAGGSGPMSIGGVITAVIVGAVTTAFTVLGAAFTAKLYLAAADRADPAVGAA